jgi:hypothetical protein
VDPPAGRNGRGHKSQARQVRHRPRKRKADMKVFTETMERRYIERKAYNEKILTKWEADREKREAHFEKMMTKWKANREVVGSWKPFTKRQTPAR